jgi:hypothetical protein
MVLTQEFDDDKTTSQAESCGGFGTAPPEAKDQAIRSPKRSIPLDQFVPNRQQKAPDLQNRSALRHLSVFDALRELPHKS